MKAVYIIFLKVFLLRKIPTGYWEAIWDLGKSQTERCFDDRRYFRALVIMKNILKEM